MKSTITLTVYDLIEAKKLSIRPRKPFLIVLCILLALTGCFLVFGVYTAATQNSSDKSWIWALGGILYLGFLYYLIVYDSAKKQFKQSKKLSEPFEIEITQDSLKTKASYGEAELKFTDYHKWKFNEQMILLYQSDALFQIIPSRAFSSEEERQLAISQIQEHCGSPIK